MKKLVFLFSALFLFSCSSEEGDKPSGGEGGNGNMGVNRTAFLNAVVDVHAIPDYERFAMQLQVLKTDVKSFSDTPTQETLNKARATWLKTYEVYQSVAAYNFGLAEETAYRSYMNGYPTDIEEIKGNIDNESFTVESLGNSDLINSQGLPAIDYIINGLDDSDAIIIDKFNEDAKYGKHLGFLVDRMISFTDRILNDWKGDYKKEFTSNTSETKSGSFNLFVDRYINFYEKIIRTGKIGRPAGELSKPKRPQQIEALFSPENSRDLAIVAIKDAERIYLGNSEDEASLSAILLERDRVDLDLKIKSEFKAAIESVESLNANLNIQAETDADTMLATRAVLHALVVTMKTDLITELGIELLTFDSDGD